MKLVLKRKYKGGTYNIGDLLIDGVFFCNTIEDKVRRLPSICPNTPKLLLCSCKEKIDAGTAIPASTYKIMMEYSPRFKCILPYLHNVPHFIGILMWLVLISSVNYLISQVSSLFSSLPTTNLLP